jgi:hypothetical protein
MSWKELAPVREPPKKKPLFKPIQEMSIDDWIALTGTTTKVRLVTAGEQARYLCRRRHD